MRATFYSTVPCFSSTAIHAFLEEKHDSSANGSICRIQRVKRDNKFVLFAMIRCIRGANAGNRLSVGRIHKSKISLNFNISVLFPSLSILWCVSVIGLLGITGILGCCVFWVVFLSVSVIGLQNMSLLCVFSLSMLWCVSVIGLLGLSGIWLCCVFSVVFMCVSMIGLRNMSLLCVFSCLSLSLSLF